MTFKCRPGTQPAVDLDLLRNATRFHSRRRWRFFLPGDVLKWLIHHATSGRAKHGVQCELFRQMMNGWGWWGCWKQREKILKRIRKEAAAEGYETTPRSLCWMLCKGLVRGILSAVLMPQKSIL